MYVRGYVENYFKLNNDTWTDSVLSAVVVAG